VSADGVLFNKDMSLLVVVPGGKSGQYEIPGTVSTIGAASFAVCGKLTSITIPESVSKIEDMAFFGCYGMSSLTIPNSVTSIGDYAFQDCYGLRAVNISESLTKIGVSAFCKCEKLTSVIMPESIKSIGEGAFSGCTSLTSVTLPKYVTTIDAKVFDGGRKILEVNYDTTEPIEANSDLFDPAVYMDATLNIAVGGLEKMKATKPWMNFAHINEKYYSGIEETAADPDKNTRAGIFNLHGVKMKDSIDMLPEGIYIINGKKTYVR
ncbi:MAG: leucine-rich repeat domain-containing protein, partial [Muribaculaceae bacterium]|nr:leucine-rich repeat domain-containing protein [Muribaculaceae bacterium]